MCIKLHYSFPAKACELAILFKAILAFSKVAFATSIAPSLEILSYS